jgi:hypothetical protein
MSYYSPRHNQFIYWTDISNHVEIKKKILPIIINKKEETKNNNPFKNSNVNTSLVKITSKLSKNYNDFLKEKYILEPIIDIIKNLFKNFNFLININNIYIKNIWFNFYNINDFQETHNHNKSNINIINNIISYGLISFIYILNDDTLDKVNIKERNNIKFNFNKLLNHTSLDRKLDINTRKYLDIKEGTLIVFNSNLNHLVSPVKNNGRITISGNLFIN